MKKHLSLIFFCVSIAVFVCLCVVGTVIYDARGTDILLSVAVAVAGLVAFYLIHNLIHELFHALFVLFSGGKITSLSFWGFELDFLGKEVNFKPSSLYAGWTSFLAKKPQNAEKILKVSLCGGFIGSCVAMCLAVFFGFFVFGGVFAFEFFVAGGVSACFYMLVVNFVPVIDNNDGSLLFLKGDRFVAAAERIETESNLYLGKTLEETFPLTLEKKFGKRCASIYDAWYFLSCGDMGIAKAVLNNLVSKNDDNEVIAPLTERFFIACTEKDEKKVEEMKDVVLSDIAKSNELFSLRAHVAYRIFTGETEWAEILIQSYRRASLACPLTGLAKTDNAIFDKYVTILSASAARNEI